MKRRVTASRSLSGFAGGVLLLAAVWGSQAALADTFDDGLTAYRNGDYGQAAKTWQAAKRPKDPQVLFGLGTLYAEGQGLKRSPGKAAEFFQMAADSGLVPAQFNLGLAYLSGDGVEKNPREARNWWEKAALQGYVPAQRNLGSLLWNGDGVEREQAEALHWFRKAAASGNLEARRFLDSLFQGMTLQLDTTGAQTAKAGITPFIRGQLAFEQKDYKRAHEIWQPLAEEGDLDAQYYVGYLHESGQGVKQDPEQAAAWYESAAGQGQAQAQFNLGMLYVNGQGVEQNEGLGLYWIQSAADNDDARAKEYMESLR